MAGNATWHVYLLRCADGKIYTGCTGNLDQRMIAHRKGEVSFTKTRLPFELISYITFHDKHKAYSLKNISKVARERLL